MLKNLSVRIDITGDDALKKIARAKGLISEAEVLLRDVFFSEIYQGKVMETKIPNSCNCQEFK